MKAGQVPYSAGEIPYVVVWGQTGGHLWGQANLLTALSPGRSWVSGCEASRYSIQDVKASTTSLTWSRVYTRAVVTQTLSLRGCGRQRRPLGAEKVPGERVYQARGEWVGHSTKAGGREGVSGAGRDPELAPAALSQRRGVVSHTFSHTQNSGGMCCSFCWMNVGLK